MEKMNRNTVTECLKFRDTLIISLQNLQLWLWAKLVSCPMCSWGGVVHGLMQNCSSK